MIKIVFYCIFCQGSERDIDREIKLKSFQHGLNSFFFFYEIQVTKYPYFETFYRKK